MPEKDSITFNANHPVTVTLTIEGANALNCDGVCNDGKPWRPGDSYTDALWKVMATLGGVYNAFDMNIRLDRGGVHKPSQGVKLPKFVAVQYSILASPFDRTWENYSGAAKVPTDGHQSVDDCAWAFIRGLLSTPGEWECSISINGGPPEKGLIYVAVMSDGSVVRTGR